MGGPWDLNFRANVIRLQINLAHAQASGKFGPSGATTTTTTVAGGPTSGQPSLLGYVGALADLDLGGHADRPRHAGAPWEAGGVAECVPGESLRNALTQNQPKSSVSRSCA
eukprot:6718580-Pyramimonas_sp.AAC.1